MGAASFLANSRCKTAKYYPSRRAYSLANQRLGGELHIRAQQIHLLLQYVTLVRQLRRRFSTGQGQLAAAHIQSEH